MSNKPISPWADHAEQASPDGKYRAIFQNGIEVAMGAPTLGELILRVESGGEHSIVYNAAASFVWSEDSRFLAFSKWRRNKKQSLCVLRLSDMKVDESPDEFRVLELRSFLNGRIQGVDSSVHMPRTFSLKYD